LHEACAAQGAAVLWPYRAGTVRLSRAGAYEAIRAEGMLLKRR